LIQYILMSVGGLAVLYFGTWAGWRFWWFWRNPARTPVVGDHLLCPADGTVVYVKRVEPGEPVVSIKEGLAARIEDIAKEEMDEARILIGIFMSPFDVHHNRAPLSGTVESRRQYPAVGKNAYMGAMHWRTILGHHPMYANSVHIVQNNRAVTRMRGWCHGEELSCYVVQIGGGGVNGIAVYPEVGEPVKQGEIFGMIKIGSQVDLIVPAREWMDVLVKPGDKVTAGLTVLIGVKAGAEKRTEPRVGATEAV
jgi:phosphatidylserine decarboxylase